MQKRLKIKENFYLVEKTLNTEVKVIKDTLVNQILVLDVSYSMVHDLPALRQTLKNKLPTLLLDNSTLTIIWFSSYGQAGILQEGLEVKNVVQLEALKKNIDQWIRPVGATAFESPLLLVRDVIDRLKIKKPKSIFNMIFCTDGYSNSDRSWKHVIDALKNIAPDLAGSYFVEVGFYADSKRIQELSEISGGEKILAENFESYENILIEKSSKSINSAKKIFVEIPTEYRKFDFAYTINSNNEVLVYGINEQDNQILLPEDTEKLYYFSSTDAKEFGTFDINDNQTIKTLYAAIYILSDKLKVQDAEDIFGILGDKYAFDIFVNAYGKQKLNSFKALVKDCISNEAIRFKEGRVDNLVVDEHAYCLMTCIADLQAFEDNRFYPSHEAFKYNRIGQKKVQKSMSEFSVEDKERLATITDIAELKSVVEDLTNKYNDFELKFETIDKEKGYPLTELEWNSKRANLSVKVMYYGNVLLPENQFKLKSIDSVIFRNYTILKDGILNIKKLPVSLNKHTYNILCSYNLIEGDEAWKEGRIFILNLSSLPVVNRSMTQSISALNLAHLEWQLLQDKGATKVYKYYENKLFETKSQGYVEKYGMNATLWLNSLGFSENNGFSPKTELQDSTDFYMSVNLETKIAGCSSIPKVEDVIPKVEKLIEIENKLQDPDMLTTDVKDKLHMELSKLFKVSETLMVPAIKDYLTQTSSKLYLSQKPEIQLEILKTWIKDAKIEANKKRRALMQNIAQIKFGIILSRGWMTEFKSMDENELEIELIKGEKPLKVKFVSSEEEEKI